MKEKKTKFGSQPEHERVLKTPFTNITTTTTTTAKKRLSNLRMVVNHRI